jgi:hypothetical protein
MTNETPKYVTLKHNNGSTIHRVFECAPNGNYRVSSYLEDMMYGMETMTISEDAILTKIDHELKWEEI